MTQDYQAREAIQLVAKELAIAGYLPNIDSEVKVLMGPLQAGIAESEPPGQPSRLDDLEAKVAMLMEDVARLYKPRYPEAWADSTQQVPASPEPALVTEPPLPYPHIDAADLEGWKKAAHYWHEQWKRATAKAAESEPPERPIHLRWADPYTPPTEDVRLSTEQGAWRTERTWRDRPQSCRTVLIWSGSDQHTGFWDEGWWRWDGKSGELLDDPHAKVTWRALPPPPGSSTSERPVSPEPAAPRPHKLHQNTEGQWFVETGEVRPPRSGEWYVWGTENETAGRHRVQRATFDFLSDGWRYFILRGPLKERVYAGRRYVEVADDRIPVEGELIDLLGAIVPADTSWNRPRPILCDVGPVEPLSMGGEE